MAKGFGKFLAGVVIAGAAAAGVYYLLKAKEDEDDFDDFDDDVNDDLEDFLKFGVVQVQQIVQVIRPDDYHFHVDPNRRNHNPIRNIGGL